MLETPDHRPQYQTKWWLVYLCSIQAILNGRILQIRLFRRSSSDLQYSWDPSAIGFKPVRWHRQINRGILQGKSSLLHRQSCIRCGHGNSHNAKEDVDSSARVIVPGPLLLLRSSMEIHCIPCIVLSRAVYWTSQQVCSLLSTLSNHALHSSRACSKKIGIIESFCPCCWRYQRKLCCLKKDSHWARPHVDTDTDRTW